MMRLFSFTNPFRKCLLALSLAFLLPFLAKADWSITVVTTQNGDEVTADFLVHNFQEVLSFQFTAQWAPTELQFKYVDGYGLSGLSSGNIGTTLTGSGYLVVGWADPNVVGVTLNDCDRLFSIKFHSPFGANSPILINGSIISNQSYDGNGNPVILFQSPICSNFGQIKGNVFNDIDSNCAQEQGEPGLEKLEGENCRKQ